MEWDKKQNAYLLKSGRYVYANGGVFGLAIEGDLDISQGWDGDINWPTEEWEPPHERQLFDEDALEIAETMILRWTELRDSLIKK